MARGRGRDRRCEGERDRGSGRERVAQALRDGLVDEYVVFDILEDPRVDSCLSLDAVVFHGADVPKWNKLVVEGGELLRLSKSIYTTRDHSNYANIPTFRPNAISFLSSRSAVSTKYHVRPKTSLRRRVYPRAVIPNFPSSSSPPSTVLICPCPLLVFVRRLSSALSSKHDMDILIHLDLVNLARCGSILTASS